MAFGFRKQSTAEIKRKAAELRKKNKERTDRLKAKKSLAKEKKIRFDTSGFGQIYNKVEKAQKKNAKRKKPLKRQEIDFGGSFF